jgi:Raf kinase inhibitor-like YbhB/YbcL family protein
MGGTGGAGGGPGGGGPFTLTSPAFAEGAMIPAANACNQQQGMPGLSPQLDWTGVPADTQSFAIIMKDLDFNGFHHWAIWDIPAAENGLPEGVPLGHMPTMPAGAKQAESFSNNVYGYIGPCSPNSVNTYEFTIYAIDVATLPGLDMQTTMAEAEAAAQAASLGSAALSGES